MAWFEYIVKSMKYDTPARTLINNQATFLLICFSCPEQLNRWPCHWLTQDFTTWLILTILGNYCICLHQKHLFDFPIRHFCRKNVQIHHFCRKNVKIRHFCRKKVQIQQFVANIFRTHTLRKQWGIIWRAPLVRQPLPGCSDQSLNNGRWTNSSWSGLQSNCIESQFGCTFWLIWFFRFSVLNFWF